MDDQAAKKVIAAIERLSNRIAKLDETSVEAAAIANEARRAAMNAAEATDPKRTAEHMAKSVTPIAKTIDAEIKNVFDGMGRKLNQALAETDKTRSSLEDAKRDYRYVRNEESERGRANRSATWAAAGAITLIFCGMSWVLHSHSVNSVRSCRAFGGHAHLDSRRSPGIDGPRLGWTPVQVASRPACGGPRNICLTNKPIPPRHFTFVLRAVTCTRLECWA